MSTAASVKLIAAAVAVCVGAFLIQFAFNYAHLRSGPHHWYAERLYIPYVSRRSYHPQPITVRQVAGPYGSRQVCQTSVAHEGAGYREVWACLQMLDRDAATAAAAQ
jgi:hypothetical protein